MTMFIRRTRINLVKLLCTAIILLIVVYYFQLLPFPINERTIADQTCVLPHLNVYDSEVMKFYKKYERLKCFHEKEWVMLDGGQFIISADVEAKFGKISCNTTSIERKTDYETIHGQTTVNVVNGSDIKHDFYHVECKANNGKQYTSIHAGIRKDLDINMRPITFSEKGLNLDILMFGQDSTSRMAFQRHQPKSRKYFVEELGAIELEGYTILGDGTPAALMPILIGKREEELPEARRSFRDAKPVDEIFPFIWKKFRKHGYATMWSEPSPNIGTFHYRMLGFQKQPVDHYYRTFAFEEEKHLVNESCVGARTTYNLVLEYAYQMWKTYPRDRRKFSFTFLSHPSHSDNNKMAMYDDEIVEYLHKFQDGGYLNNTMLILMGDHGARFANVRKTDQGKLEERLPYFAVRFPSWVHKQHPDLINNFKHNAKKLTTPFDIHETFLEVMNFTGTGDADISRRAVSLFKKIPSNRTCASANIDDHWCSCLNWQRASNNSQDVIQAAEAAIYHFNNMTDLFRSKCAILKLSLITSAFLHTTRDGVLQFKDTSDGGRGRFGKMTDKTKRTFYVYQLTLITKPGDAQFEVTLTHNTQTGVYSIDKSGISRVNKYGDQPKCVASEAPHLREFCYCKM